tara:strand:+ start:10160 stop:12916 length:2757 start_codon:yes stop_codon:yes gene_type:complete
MIKRFITQSIYVLLVVFPLLNWAQSISGKILDQDKTPLEYVAVAILNPDDSILISYDNTDKTGTFELKEIPKGKVIFQVHLLGYKTYQKIISFKNKSIFMGDIILEFENKLDEVIVTAILPISIKTDTIAFNTKAFKIRVEDTAEDLLKKLPGIEVDASGAITAQGEEVSKIYVDGKEFFSGDPLIATKNLSADAIKRIEVIDEKSEKSRVSGINDAVRNKVINIQLKDDKKVNDFGKAQGGYGTDDRYLTSLNYNRFSSKLQTSIIGKLNNVNTSGSDISEVIQFNGGRGGSFNSNSGFLTTGVAGINMGYEFKKKQDLNADYFYNYTDRTSGDVVRNRTEYINDTEIKSVSKSSSENLSNSNKLNFNYRDRSDKLKSLTIKGNGRISNNEGSSKGKLDRYNAFGELDLESESISNSQGDGNSGNVSFDLTKRFNENSKRYISTSAKLSGSNSASESNNIQTNTYTISNPLNNSNLFIKKSEESSGSSLSYDLDYTEPITESHLISFEVDVEYSASDEDVNQSKIENEIDQSPLIYKEFYNKTSLSGEMKYIYDKERFTFSASARIVEQTQKFGLENESDFINNYTNVNPEISIRYNRERSEFFRFSARKRVNLPSSTQLSPAVNNFNPLYVRRGNTDLIPEDNYSIFAMYGKHNLASGFSLFTRISYNYTVNSIGNYTLTDQLGVRYSSYDNLGDKNSLSSTFSFGNRIKSLDVRYRVRFGGSYNEYYSLIGFQDSLGGIKSDLNKTHSKAGNLSLSLENNKKEKLDASIGATWNRNFTTFTSTSGTNSDRNYLQQTYWTKLDWNATNRFTINSQFKYDIYTDSTFPTDQAVPIWNATLSYAITKSKDLTVMISALDILNESIGLERKSNDNYFEEVNKDVLGNYYMLSLTYNLNGNKGKGKRPSSNRHVRGRGYH